MKKHRGLKRYYQKLEQQSEFDTILGLDLKNHGTWPKYWHLHFDYGGLGDHNFKRRKPHLDKLFRHFDFLAEKTSVLKFDFQLYAIILDFHSSSDALYLHIPDFNNRQFPFRIEDLSTVSTLKNQALNNYLEHLKGYEKLYGHTKQGFCLIYKKDVGQPFVEAIRRVFL